MAIESTGELSVGTITTIPSGVGIRVDNGDVGIMSQVPRKESNKTPKVSIITTPYFIFSKTMARSSVFTTVSIVRYSITLTFFD